MPSGVTQAVAAAYPSFSPPARLRIWLGTIYLEVLIPARTANA